MKKSRARVYLAAALLLASISAFLLPGQIKRSRARREAVSDLLAQETITVGNETLDPVKSDVRAKWKRYRASRGGTASVMITDMEQAAVVTGEDVSGTEITVYSGEEEVFCGDADQFADFFPENGTYRMEAVCSLDTVTVTSQGEELKVRGTARYEARLEYDIPMQITFMSDHIRQGSAVPVTGSGVRGEVIISAGQLAAPFPLVTDGQGYAKGLFSISYSTEPGSYTAEIRTDEGISEFRFTVEEELYTVQHLTVSAETASSTVGNSDNSKAYSAMMNSTYESWYPQRYYDDCFTRPLTGRVTTEFGLFRYTNDNPVPTRHVGVDIANEEGTPVLAAASGYVIIADYNGISGNTVVIDHGLGVRTYYFHMSVLSVKQGEFVREGTEIGKVGATGYATGPHLHFNVMVHDNSIDPWPTFNGTSGIFGLE